MIDPRYVQTMARYNSWQNSQLVPLLESLSPELLAEDRGAFFGGLLATANHLLWGDMLWMSRFDPTVTAPTGGIAESTAMHDRIESYCADRSKLDAQITNWANRLEARELEHDLTWFSGAAGREITAPLQTTIIHFFNHQTHHRGQIHAMLTAAGIKAPVSDLFLLPKET